MTVRFWCTITRWQVVGLQGCLVLTGNDQDLQHIFPIDTQYIFGIKL